MTTARITALMLDGTKHEATGVYLALADRLAFERRFGYSIFRDTKRMRVEQDGTGTAEVDVGDLREEEHAFMCWCILHRAGLVGDYDVFTAGVESIGRPDFQDGPVDPTDPDLPPGK